MLYFSLTIAGLVVFSPFTKGIAPQDQCFPSSASCHSGGESGRLRRPGEVFRYSCVTATAGVRAICSMASGTCFAKMHVQDVPGGSGAFRALRRFPCRRIVTARQTDRQIETDRQSETYRQTDRQIARQRQTERERETKSDRNTHRHQDTKRDNKKDSDSRSFRSMLGQV